MNNTSLFNRTVKTNIILYKSNGQGRDDYILHDNGGFWKNAKPIKMKEYFYRSPFGVYHSWNRTPPIWVYHSDGSGRDSYVYNNNGGLMKKYNSLVTNCKNFLWLKNEEESKCENMKKKIKLTRGEKIYLQRINKIQNDLVDRLYNKRNIRKKIFNKDKSKINMNNSNEASFSLELKDNKKNSLIKSSSQFFEKKQLDPIKCYKSHEFNIPRLMLNNKFNSNSMRNIFKKNTNINLNKNNYYYKKKFIFDSLNSKFTKFPKVKCTIESNDNKNNLNN